MKIWLMFLDLFFLFSFISWKPKPDISAWCSLIKPVWKKKHAFELFLTILYYILLRFAEILIITPFSHILNFPVQQYTTSTIFDIIFELAQHTWIYFNVIFTIKYLRIFLCLLSKSMCFTSFFEIFFLTL